MKFIKFCAIVAFCAVFLGCESEKSVDYYRANLEVAKGVVAQCNAKSKQDKNCQNARAALREVAEKMNFAKSKVKLSFNTIFSDFGAYYVAKGEFSEPGSMTNVSLPLQIGDKTCAQFHRVNGAKIEVSINRDDEICAGVFSDVKNGVFDIGSGALIETGALGVGSGAIIEIK
ncbi:MULTISPECIES: EexN family lipoprotein [unclassified Campylobacter]|uniref:EexN family lipoprotein n=1 Tax=unclassified Campylobacter TaxID=2593542 RepID=UPI0022E9B5B8|nr:MULTISPECIES: EexN family lipoprotein [unclassified Campylobacter]MDA3062611.1 EexN family lipoprotein [Campylobacter sp. JMF_14 EL1]MDA3073867.1 EexN family lipoprotein [Campylobacter sp. JMF_10 EL2]